MFDTQIEKLQAEQVTLLEQYRAYHEEIRLQLVDLLTGAGILEAFNQLEVSREEHRLAQQAIADEIGHKIQALISLRDSIGPEGVVPATGQTNGVSTPADPDLN